MRILAICFACCCFSSPRVMSQVKLSFDYENHIVLSGQINQKSVVRLVLDSGADGLYLDSTYFSETGIPAYSRQLATLPGAGSQPQQVMVVMDTIAVNLSGIQFIPRYTPLLHLRPILGQDVDGIIGLSFLRRYIALLDYENKMLSLYDPQQYDPQEGFEAIPMNLRNNRIYIPLEISITDDVVIKKEFQLDLGNGGTIDITSATANEFDLSDLISEKLHYSNAFGGVGGEIVGNQFRAMSVKIGSYKIELPVLDYSEDKSGALSSAEMGGLLGNKILERFDLIFDFKNSSLYIRTNGRNEAFHSSLTGFSFTNRRDELGGLLLTGLFENTLAVKAGLRVGDLITHINDKAVKSLEPRVVEQIFKSVQSEVKLTVKRDEEDAFNIRLLLKDYL